MSEFKMTKIGRLPKEWEISYLRDVSKIQGGFAFDSKSFLERGEYQVLKMSNLYSGVLDLDRSKSFFNNIDKSQKEFIVNKNDILLTLTGTVGKRDYGHTVFIENDNKWLLNQRVGRIITNLNKSNPSFLYYVTKTERFCDQFFFTARGGTGNQANVGTKDVEEILIPLPPLPEQQKIAAILRGWDTAIDTTEKLITALKQRHRTLMHQLLSGKKRVKGFENEKWQTMVFNEIFDRVNRKNVINCQNVLTISAQQGLINQEDFFKKQIASESFLHYYLLKNGDFAYNKSYSNGYPFGAFKRLEKYEEGILSPLYICFSLKEDKGDSDFFQFFFNSGGMNKSVSEIAQEGARNHGLLNISVVDFFEIKIKAPPSLAEQQKIAEILRGSEKEIQAYEQYVAQLRPQKRGLMQVLLTGRVRVKING